MLYNIDNNDKIKGFYGEYRWLSNFYQCNILHEGITYPTLEHAYQASKILVGHRQEFLLSNPTASLAKKNWKNYPLIYTREGWETVKLDVMGGLLIQKFLSKEFKHLLLSTGDKYIEETNDWGDVYWGFDIKQNKGENILGLLIMTIRMAIQDMQEPFPRDL